MKISLEWIYFLVTFWSELVLFYAVCGGVTKDKGNKEFVETRLVSL